uniref:Chromosome 17 open reading frame 78 n=1 Tax=Monodelphis domestica TaxID=13616 RepID=F7GF68_MONDO
MDTILFFSLIFASYDANQKELEGSSCQVEQLPGLFPRDMRSIRVLLIQEAQGEAKRQAPGHNQIVANLQCLGSGRKVIVNLQDSEKRPKTRYTLKSLSVMTAPPQDSPSRLRCYLSTAPKMWFQGGRHFTIQVFLPNISNCKFYPVVEDSSEGLTATSIITTAPEDKEERPTITGNYSFVEQQDPDEDLLMRQKWSIVVKALIAITLLISGVAITVFVIFEVPCPVSLLLMMKPWPTGSRETVLFPSSSSNPKVSNSSSPKMAAEIIVIHQTYF